MLTEMEWARVLECLSHLKRAVVVSGDASSIHLHMLTVAVHSIWPALLSPKHPPRFGIFSVPGLVLGLCQWKCDKSNYVETVVHI